MLKDAAASKPKKKKRKSRANEVTCHCSAYHFPHMFGGGRCNAKSFAEDYWEEHQQTGFCRDCRHVDANGMCQVYEGKEAPRYCEAVEDFCITHNQFFRLK